MTLSPAFLSQEGNISSLLSLFKIAFLTQGTGPGWLLIAPSRGGASKLWSVPVPRPTTPSSRNGGKRKWWKKVSSTRPCWRRSSPMRTRLLTASSWWVPVRIGPKLPLHSLDSTSDHFSSSTATLRTLPTCAPSRSTGLALAKPKWKTLLYLRTWCEWMLPRICCR